VGPVLKQSSRQVPTTHVTIHQSQPMQHTFSTSVHLLPSSNANLHVYGGIKPKPVGAYSPCSHSCSPTNRILRDAQFQGVIPAGESFTIPVGQLSDVQYQGYGFNWTVNARASTPIFIIAGDERGLGSAGCADFTISSGTEPNNSCIIDNSPSVTPGQPAGAVRPTDSPNDQPQPNRSNR
jgi:hypothetical protein